MAPESTAANPDPQLNGAPTSDADKSTSNAEEEAPSEDLIDVLFDLQKKVVASGFSLDINIPQIVVVGEQSAGKSSVLENIAGKEFLPRGTGTVTKRPILIHLHPEDKAEYAVFGHIPDKHFTDFSLVRKELENQMPKDGGFTKVPVQIEIHSPRVLKLTLVDLPGVIFNNLDDQQDSVDDVKKMVLEHISNPECIILAVISANVDLQNSYSLKIAEEVDPERSRTIGVVTKIDIMDKGTNALDILNNRKIFLKRGYVGVINRSQQDIIDKKDITSILKKEKEFFTVENPCYKSIAHRLGTPYLQEMLQKTLRLHIKKSLPKLRVDLATRLTTYEEELRKLDCVLGEGEYGKENYLMLLVNQFIVAVYDEIKGFSEDINFDTLSAGACIHYVFNCEIVENLKIALIPTDEEVTRAIINLGGMDGAISLPSQAVKVTCKNQIKKFEYPIMQSVDSVCRIFKEAIENSSEMLGKYPSAKQEIVFQINQILNTELNNTKEKLREHLSSEMQYINLEHPDLDFSVCQPSVPPPNINPKVWESVVENDPVPSTAYSNTQGAAKVLYKKNQTLMQVLLQNESMKKKAEFVIIICIKYLEIVSKQVTDTTIKYIVNFLIMKVLFFMKNKLVPILSRSKKLKALTEDCDEDFERKCELEVYCITLKEALAAIERF